MSCAFVECDFIYTFDAYDKLSVRILVFWIMPIYSQDAVRDCIKSYLQSKRLTYQDLADLLGLKLPTVNNYMSKKDMSEKTVGRIAEVLGYPKELLFRGERYYGPDAYKALEERVRRLEEAVFAGKDRL